MGDLPEPKYTTLVDSKVSATLTEHAHGDGFKVFIFNGVVKKNLVSAFYIFSNEGIAKEMRYKIIPSPQVAFLIMLVLWRNSRSLHWPGEIHYKLLRICQGYICYWSPEHDWWFLIFTQSKNSLHGNFGGSCYVFSVFSAFVVFCYFQDTTPVMTKIYSTLGRRFNKKDLEEAQRMGEELVKWNIT